MDHTGAGRRRGSVVSPGWYQDGCPLGDETKLRSDDVPGRGYAPRGVTPLVRVTHRRARLGIISTVANQGAACWRIFDGAMSPERLIDFVKRLVKDTAHKVFLILDNLRVHRAGKVKDWLAAHDGEIKVFYLSHYSPELFLGEGLNADLKDNVMQQVPARSKSPLKKAAIRHLRRLQQAPQSVRKHFEQAIPRKNILLPG